MTFFYVRKIYFHAWRTKHTKSTWRAGRNLWILRLCEIPNDGRVSQRFAELPSEVREQAREAYRLFSSNPCHASLHFKRAHTKRLVFAARVGRHYRVLGLREEENVIVWFWIGPHEQYEKLLANI
ncbi:MAG: hypothetical protein QOK37_3523 [Thermoanaerobaculia bacterium]|nr:hypothetical protein [Thermoanaerobaculia bacterium]